METNAKIALNFIPNCTVPGWFKDKNLSNGTTLTKLVNIYPDHKPFEGEYWVNNPQIRFHNHIAGI